MYINGSVACHKTGRKLSNNFPYTACKVEIVLSAISAVACWRLRPFSALIIRVYALADGMFPSVENYTLSGLWMGSSIVH